MGTKNADYKVSGIVPRLSLDIAKIQLFLGNAK